LVTKTRYGTSTYIYLIAVGGEAPTHVPTVGDLFNTSEDRLEDRVRQIRHEDPDVSEPARDAATCASIGMELQGCRNLEDPRAVFLAHARTTVEGSRDGRDRHACLTGYIVDGRHESVRSITKSETRV